MPGEADWENEGVKEISKIEFIIWNGDIWWQKFIFRVPGLI